MNSIVQLGDVPAWISVGTGAAGLYLGIRNRRQQQATAWAAMVEELTGLTDLELRRVVEDNPVVAEIVGRAWEAAVETASHDKRRLLAKVAVAAIRGYAAAQVDELQFLLRTVIELDPAHVTLLVAIGHDWSGNVDQLAAKWPSPPHLLFPALSSLGRAGLTSQPHQLVGGPAENWRLTSYGRRFLNFLEETDEAEATS
jgi:hypothetical protein